MLNYANYLKGEDMKNKRRLSMANSLIFMIIIFFIFHATSMRWLDNHSWILYPDNRSFVKALPYFYLKNPFSSQENDVERTIKIARFIALSQQNNKSFDVILKDLFEAQKLIDKFIRNYESELDSDSMSELLLNRLIILNRIYAIFLSKNKTLLVDVDVVRRDADALIPLVYNPEIKRALEKEIKLFDSISLDYNVNDLDGFDWFDIVDRYHFGLARCVTGDDSGGKLISTSLAYIPRKNLIDITMLNVDFPLLVAAGMASESNGNPLCINAVNEILNKLRG